MAAEYNTLAPNVIRWNVEGAIEKGFLTVSGGGQTRTVSINKSGCNLMGYFKPDNVDLALLRGWNVEVGYDGSNMFAVEVPQNAVRWCVTSTPTICRFQEVTLGMGAGGFGGMYLPQLAFDLLWYDGTNWYSTYTGDLPVVSHYGSVKQMYFGDWLDGEPEVASIAIQGFDDARISKWAAPLVTNPDYGYYSGLIYSPLHVSIHGAPFIANRDQAVTYVTTGVDPTQQPDPDFGPPSEPEGYDGYVAPVGGDDIGLPTTPPSALASGLLNLYKIEAGALQQLGSELFPSINWPSPGQDILQWIGELIKKFSDSVWNKDLIDYIISIHLVPCELSNTSLTDIKVGPRTMSGILGRPQSSEYVDIDFGSVNVDNVYKNFGDYLTNVRLFLPFYGFVPVNIQDCMGGSIAVKYRFNVIDGSFMAYVSVTSNKSHKNNSLIGQYGGSAVIHLPLTGSNYANMFSNVIGSGAGMAAGIATGSVGLAATSAVNLASSMGGGGGREGNNSYNASSAIMSRRKPFLSVERVVSSFSTAYIDEKGIPSNIEYVLGNCQGFTKVMDPIMDGLIGATDKDVEELRRLLKEGVYF